MHLKDEIETQKIFIARELIIFDIKFDQSYF